MLIQPVVSSHSRHHSQEIYFCTVTCYKWLPLIKEANAYPSVYRWFHHLKPDGCKVLGFVIMHNHFHVLLYPSHSGTSINMMIGECKRFMAYDIVQSLKMQNRYDLLQLLEDGVSAKERLKGKLHQVFEISFDARLCLDETMVEQKLDYIHHNPVSGKWNLVEDFALYEHSSAGYYELGVDSGFITHYKELNGPM